MIKKQNIKRNPQRLKHKVRLDIEFYENPKNKKIELLIVFIQKGGVSDGKLLLGDIIKSINGIAVNNKEIEFDNEINKINWGDEATFEVERKNKIQNIISNPDSWNHFSGSVMKSKLDYSYVPTERGKRYFGTTKMTETDENGHAFKNLNTSDRR